MGIGLRWDVLAIKAKTTGLDLGVVVESEEGERLESNFLILGSKE